MDRVPAALFQVFFHDEEGRWLRWQTARIWALPTPAAELDASGLWWHLELPIWASAPPTSIFDLSPAQVLAAPERYSEHWTRVVRADLGHPLELFENFGRWVIMDGYHRLARHRLEAAERVPVRLHDRGLLSEVLCAR